MTAPSKLQVQEALVTLACVSGMMEAFGKNADFLGDDLAAKCAATAKELDGAREILRTAAGAE